MTLGGGSSQIQLIPRRKISADERKRLLIVQAKVKKLKAALEEGKAQAEPRNLAKVPEENLNGESSV